MRRVINLTGKKFGRLTVIKMASNRESTGKIRWICKCDCGKTNHVTSGESLRNKNTKSCGCLKHEAPYNLILNREEALWKQAYFTYLIKRVRNKKFNTDININEFKNMVKRPCIYCGITNFYTLEDLKYKTHQKISDTKISFNGLDRIDSSKGYLKNNTVSCCKNCNLAKNTLSQSEFFDLIRRIYKYSDLGFMQNSL
jgi:hypothetical protein